MEYEIRWVMGHEIPQALDLAWRIFVKYDAPDYGAEHTERMRVAIEDRLKDLSIYEERLMVVAIADNKVVGMLETYGANRISLLFVDSEYQRKGIATAMMNKIAGELKHRGYDKIVLNASPYGLAFYKHYGFIVAEEEKKEDTPWKTPMWYPLSMQRGMKTEGEHEMIYKYNETVSSKALSDLREAVGWNRMEKEYESPLMTSYYHIAAYENEEFLGYIDCVSNGVTDAYIQDLMVHPDYQGKGVGTDLMNQMIKYLKEKRIYIISVVFEESLKPFYDKFGFCHMLCGQMETYNGEV